MDIIAGILVGEGFVPLIPVWFYLFSSVAYGASALISILVSYYSFKIFWPERKLKSNLFLSLGFFGLGIAFTALTFTSAYTYLRNPFFQEGPGLNFVNLKGFNLYYAASLVSYILLVIAYLPRKIMGRLTTLPLLYVPLWYINFTNFNIISIILLALVNLKTIKNFLNKKSLNSFLVMICFIAMIAFHGLIFALTFDITFYLLAHVLLAAGFISLLVALIRVNRDVKKKK